MYVIIKRSDSSLASCLFQGIQGGYCDPPTIGMAQQLLKPKSFFYCVTNIRTWSPENDSSTPAVTGHSLAKSLLRSPFWM